MTAPIPPGAPKKAILIIEDSALSRRSLGRVVESKLSDLNLKGYEIVFATNCDEAARALSGRKYNLIISDFCLGKEMDDGPKLITDAKLEAAQPNYDTPAVAFSSQVEDMKALKGRPMKDFIPKKVDKAAVERILNAYLKA